MDIYSGAILVSILVYIAVGNYAGRRVKNLDDYYVAGRQAPTVLIVGTLVASLLSTNAFLGETGFVYAGQAGPFLIWPPIAASGYIFGALYFGRYLRRSRALTVAAYFGQRFNSQRVQTAAGVTIILGLGGYLLAVTQGAAVILSQLTGITYFQGTVVAWFSYTLFTMYSGSRGVVITDTIMFFLFSSVTVLALMYLIDAQGGWFATMDGLTRLEERQGMMGWYGIIGPGTPWDTPADYVSWSIIIGLAWGLVYAVSPWQSSRYLIAKNEQVVIRAACYACISVVMIQLVLYAAAAAVNLSKTDIFPHEETMIWAAKNLMPEYVGALLMAGIMAAALSSASTFLSLVGFSASNDLVSHREIDDKKMLRISRWMMLVIGVSALGIGMFIPPDIFWLTYFVGTVFASSWGPVGLMSVWSDRITANAAFWGIISGFVFNVVPKGFEYAGLVTWPAFLDPILIGAVVSLIVIVVISRRGSVTEEERTYRVRLHQTPEGEKDVDSLKQTPLASAAVIGFGVLMTVAIIKIYITPYQQATGTLQADGSLDWMTGEMILAFSWVVMLVPLGLLALRVIRKSYR